MALRQLGRRIPVFSRAAMVGSARTAMVGSGAATTASSQLHRRPLSYGFVASFPSGGAAFSTRRFFCTEPPTPTPTPLPLPRRTQPFLSFMMMFTVQSIKALVVIAGVSATLFVTCYCVGYDPRRKIHKLLTRNRVKKTD